MNRSPDVDLVLRDYFADDGSVAPDHVLDVVEERILRQPQRHAWRLPWRDLTVNANLKPIVAIAAVIAIAVAGFALMPRPSGSNVGVTAPSLSSTPLATSSPTPTPPAAATPTPTPAWNRYAHCGEPDCAGPLTAGTYTSRGFSVPVTYTLTEPWVNVSDYPEYFILYPDTPANRALASVDGAGPHPYIVMSPWTAVSPSDDCAESERAADATRVDADGFRDFMGSRDGLSVTTAGAITLSGLSGQQLDVTREPGWTGCPPHTYGARPSAETDHFRYIVLDQSSGDSLVITLWDPDDLEGFLAEAMPIVESFRFDVGPEASPS